jgi:uncharacterized protein
LYCRRNIMPVQPTYPGVYIEEVPSQVRTITGVATSITAFLGRVARGPVNESVEVTSFADFERMFGGLQVGYPLSYAVKDFYLNGGSRAIIVGLFLDPGQQAAQAVAQAAQDSAGADAAAVADDARAKVADFPDEPGASAADAVADAAEAAAGEAGATVASVRQAAADAANSTAIASVAQLEGVTGLPLVAAYPGQWGNNLAVKVDKVGITSQVADRFGIPLASLFNLTVVENPPDGPQERFLNVSLHPDAGARRIDRVLENESLRVRFPTAELPDAASSDAPADTAASADPTIKGSTPVKFTGGANSLDLEPGTYTGSESLKTGIFALDKADLFNIICIPPDTRDGDTDNTVYQAAMAYCARKRAMLIVDSPKTWGDVKEVAAARAKAGLPGLGLNGPDARNAALYFPRVLEADLLRDNQIDTFVPCGMVAGIMARTDVTRGVWKAPAGTDAALVGSQGLQVNLNDLENGSLNPLGINCLRSFQVFGRVVWGARTLRGADQLADEYKYVPVRRLALYLEESLYRGLQWVVFEPNDEPLWASIRLNVGAFMNNLFRQGAFQGQTPRDAYFVKCDKETTTQNDIDRGIVNIVVGFAPLKPAEFVIVKIQQIAGQIQV